MRYSLEDSIRIDRPAAEVFAIVSDVTRTGEWSPQCYACEWAGPDRSVGATFVGHNRTPERTWTTTSRVVANEADVEFGWAVTSSDVRWGYRLAALDDGATLLTEHTEFGATAESVFVERFGDDAEHQARVRLTAAAEGIPVTLRRIREIAESAPVPSA